MAEKKYTEKVQLLAQRMNTDEHTAYQWMKAVMDILYSSLIGSQQEKPGIHPALLPMTPESFSDSGPIIKLPHLPFRIGRQLRSSNDKWVGDIDRRQETVRPSNDLYLSDSSKRKHVSREHLSIERNDDNSFTLYDLGSTLGTIVSGKAIGGHHHQIANCPVKDGDIIIVGDSHSPYIFKFVLLPD